MKRTWESLVIQFKAIHNNMYDYPTNPLFNSVHDKISINCKIHGKFTQSIHKHKSGQGCPKCGLNKNKKRIKGSVNYNKKKLTHKEFIAKVTEINGPKYQYPNQEWWELNYKGNATKILITCSLHGEFYQMAMTAMAGGGCKECANISNGKLLRMDYEEFITKVKIVHKDIYDYNLDKEWWELNYENNITKIEITCKTHGIYEQTVGCHLAGQGCGKCGLGANVSKPELELLEYIEGLGVNVISQAKIFGNKSSVDLYIPSHNLAIEYSGILWHSDIYRDKDNHKNKFELCKALGIKLITIFETEWIKDKELVKNRIKSMLGLSEIKIYARKCIVKECETVDFLNNNHIQGSSSANVKLGLFYNDELVACMTFGKSRYNEKYEHELARFCIKQNYNIPGAANKMFSYFVVNYSPKSIISYANLRWGEGKVYEHLHFSRLTDSKPNYFYFHKNNPKKLFTRNIFQKHKLEAILENFDPNLTEFENMEINDYSKIYDCGNAVWIWVK